VPIGRLGTENRPSLLVTAFDTTPVALCLAATSAPGMMAPVVSTTVPDSACDDPPWANAPVLTAQRIDRQQDREPYPVHTSLH